MPDLQQVDQPLQMSGLRPALVGALGWAAASAVLLATRERWGPEREWWLWTCLTGLALGVAAVAVLLVRRGRRRG